MSKLASPGRKWGAWAVLLAGLLQSGPGAVEGDEVLWLRQEYNQVTASIDTLARQYGGPSLEQLSLARPLTGLVPAGMDLVLIFWADDEAEVFLNGHQVSQTRLTPIQVEIPPLYLGEQNQLRAHCWDTDRVESGFMAGLYLRDGQGRLRPILVTGEKEWKIDGGAAQEIYYNHPQPNIPGARVIWGETLFGECWLEASFAASTLRRTAQSRPVAGPRLPERDMEAHAVVGRLVRLQSRRQELIRELARHRSGSGVEVRYQGYVTGQLAFTLGQAAPWSEEQSLETSSRLHQWARDLPEVHQSLLFREERELKGVGTATVAESYEGSKAGPEDRRDEYRPPPERGPVWGAGRPRASSGSSGMVVVVRRGMQLGLWLAAAGLSIYLGLAGRRWWQVFKGEGWKA